MLGGHGTERRSDSVEPKGQARRRFRAKRRTLSLALAQDACSAGSSPATPCPHHQAHRPRDCGFRICFEIVPRAIDESQSKQSKKFKHCRDSMMQYDRTINPTNASIAVDAGGRSERLDSCSSQWRCAGRQRPGSAPRRHQKYSMRSSLVSSC
jgi:hypothetical protein